MPLFTKSKASVCVAAKTVTLLLLQLLSLEEPWTLILGDALANSFVAPVTDDVKDDEQMTSQMHKYTQYCTYMGVQLQLLMETRMLDSKHLQ
ncbi:uncharacterized protein LOC108990430 isoform X2 [Juglans regia]|uniref:Uncharacterized protein LOC108990430 isoform X2 n=1 Tax=Juglans regia TaxID=51240 RepID=A0A6P9EP18_JUGRE|nr:uncharacterized protein LOC108990430 isoform X2 [Juglans regia]